MDLFGSNSDSETDLFSHLVPPAQIEKPRLTQIDFDGLLDKPILVYEDLAKGCGGRIWRAGELLTQYILRKYMRSDQLKGKRILELGAGGGLTALAVAAGCDLEGSELFVTDMGAMIDLIHNNIALNGMKSKPELKVQLLDWKDPIPEIIAEKPVDIIFAADCVYFEPAFPLLEKTLIDLVGDNSVVYFCFEKRRKADLQFMKSIKKRLNVCEVDIKNDIAFAKSARKNLFLYTMTKKAQRIRLL